MGGGGPSWLGSEGGCEGGGGREYSIGLNPKGVQGEGWLKRKLATLISEVRHGEEGEGRGERGRIGCGGLSKETKKGEGTRKIIKKRAVQGRGGKSPNDTVEHGSEKKRGEKSCWGALSSGWGGGGKERDRGNKSQ